MCNSSVQTAKRRAFALPILNRGTGWLKTSRLHLWLRVFGVLSFEAEECWKRTHHPAAVLELVIRGEYLGTCHCARLFAKHLHLLILTPARQGAQREFTAKLAINRTKLVRKFISVVDFLWGLWLYAIRCGALWNPA
eukprot:4916956-Prymnesium_polylepis.1